MSNSPLQAFLQLAQAVSIKPFGFWPASEQEKKLRDVGAAIQTLMKTLEEKKLQSTLAYKNLTALTEQMRDMDIHEVTFIQTLRGLMTVYRQAPSDKVTKKLIDKTGVAAAAAEERAVEHHVGLELLEERGSELNNEEKTANDLQKIQEIGVFYVLEHALQALFELLKCGKEDRHALLHKGLQTPVGNLPAFVPLENTFRKDLCYNLFDPELRHTLLLAFFRLEEVLRTNELSQITTEFRAFVLTLLEAFQAKGLQEYKAFRYAPFGNNLPIKDVITKVQSLPL